MMKPAKLRGRIGAWLAVPGSRIRQMDRVLSLRLQGARLINLTRQVAVRHAPLALLGCAVAAVSFAAAPGFSGLLGGTLGLLMLAVAVADARAFIIPDELNLAAFVLGLAAAATKSDVSFPEDIAAAAVRGIIVACAFLAVRETYWRLRHRHGLGLGDVKLAAAAGVWLDWAFAAAAVELAALAALIGYTVSQLVLRRPLSRTAKLPFGLFFAPAIWLCWLMSVIFFES
jgi:leader peptidase (prepilin peptidase)/N-methyltransferase